MNTAYIYLTTNSEENKEVMNLKRCKEEFMGRFGKRKRKGENDVIVL